MARIDLLLVTPDYASVGLIVHGRRHGLPRLEHNTRSGLADRLLNEIAQHADGAMLIHWAPLSSDDCDDKLYCLAVLPHEGRIADGLSLVPLDAVDLRSLEPQETRALTLGMSRLRSPIEPFDAPSAVSELLAWAEALVASRIGAPVTSHGYRCWRQEFVVRICARGGGDVAFMKAGFEHVMDEALLTWELGKVCPKLVPATIALDRSRSRWIYEALPGSSLDLVSLTSETIAQAVHAFVTLQKQALRSDPIRAHLGQRTVSALDLLGRVDYIVTRALEQAYATPAHAALLANWRNMRGVIRNLCAEVDALELPQTLVISDLWTGNILHTPRGMVFIDVGNSYWSYPHLPLWRFARDVQGRIDRSTNALSLIEEAFVDAWSDAISRPLMLRGLAYLRHLGQLFGLLMADCDNDWRERALGEPLAPDYRASRLAGRIEAFLLSVAEHAFTTASRADSNNQHT